MISTPNRAMSSSFYTATGVLVARVRRAGRTRSAAPLGPRPLEDVVLCGAPATSVHPQLQTILHTASSKGTRPCPPASVLPRSHPVHGHRGSVKLRALHALPLCSRSDIVVIILPPVALVLLVLLSFCCDKLRAHQIVCDSPSPPRLFSWLRWRSMSSPVASACVCLSVLICINACGSCFCGQVEPFPPGLLHHLSSLLILSAGTEADLSRAGVQDRERSARLPSRFHLCHRHHRLDPHVARIPAVFHTARELGHAHH